MNQILSTKLKKTDTNLSQNTPKGIERACPKLHPKRKNWFQFQFAFSVLVMTFLLGGTGFYLYRLAKKEDFSNRLLSNYNIYRLYSTPRKDDTEQTQVIQENSNGLFGIIEIPKINLYYPIFSHLTEDLLKTSPCKFYGESPKVNGNICIAGHNYDNSLFFSKISNLTNNDEIVLFDNEGNKYLYWVYDIYEVSASDLSPVLNYNTNEKTLTLVTCNNFNGNRIILKAKQKKLS